MVNESWEIEWDDGVISPHILLPCELGEVIKKELLARNIEGLSYIRSHATYGRIQFANFTCHRIHFTHSIRNQFNTWHDAGTSVTATFTDTTGPYQSFTGRIFSVDQGMLLDGHLGWGPWKIIMMVDSYTAPTP